MTKDNQGYVVCHVCCGIGHSVFPHWTIDPNKKKVACATCKGSGTITEEDFMLLVLKGEATPWKNLT